LETSPLLASRQCEASGKAISRCGYKSSYGRHSQNDSHHLNTDSLLWTYGFD
jgi:hypothetical protein